MGTIEETKKRLNIAKDISSQLEGTVEGIMLGGSMGYGQNYSVTKDSDIDLVIVCKKENLEKLLQAPYFQNEVNNEAVDLFLKGKIALFWVTKIIDNVEINAFIYEHDKYINICLLKENLIAYREQKPSDLQINSGFDGVEIPIGRDVTKLKEGYVYTKFQLYDGKYISIPPTTDFTRGYKIVYQKEKLFDNLHDEVWKAKIDQLVKEYGANVDLDDASILKAEWIYQKHPEKLPKLEIERIENETKKRLEQYKL